MSASQFVAGMGKIYQGVCAGPAGGMGIDRLCRILLGRKSIRDVILFPQLKPK